MTEYIFLVVTTLVAVLSSLRGQKSTTLGNKYLDGLNCKGHRYQYELNKRSGCGLKLAIDILDEFHPEKESLLTGIQLAKEYLVDLEQKLLQANEKDLHSKILDHKAGHWINGYSSTDLTARYNGELYTMMGPINNNVSVPQRPLSPFLRTSSDIYNILQGEVWEYLLTKNKILTNVKSNDIRNKSEINALNDTRRLLKKPRTPAGRFDLQRIFAAMTNFDVAAFAGEMHIRNFSFAGPGSRLDLRLYSNDTPRENLGPSNKIDEVAMIHDIAYRSKDPMIRLEADVALLRSLEGLRGLGRYERSARVLMKVLTITKLKLEKEEGVQDRPYYKIVKEVLPKMKEYRRMNSLYNLHLTYRKRKYPMDKTNLVKSVSSSSLTPQYYIFDGKLIRFEDTEDHPKLFNSISSYNIYVDARREYPTVKKWDDDHLQKNLEWKAVFDSICQLEETYRRQILFENVQILNDLNLISIRSIGLMRLLRCTEESDPWNVKSSSLNDVLKHQDETFQLAPKANSEDIALILNMKEQINVEALILVWNAEAPTYKAIHGFTKEQNVRDFELWKSIVETHGRYMNILTYLKKEIVAVHDKQFKIKKLEETNLYDTSWISPFYSREGTMAGIWKWWNSVIYGTSWTEDYIQKVFPWAKAFRVSGKMEDYFVSPDKKSLLRECEDCKINFMKQYYIMKRILHMQEAVDEMKVLIARRYEEKMWAGVFNMADDYEFQATFMAALGMKDEVDRPWT